MSFLLGIGEWDDVSEGEEEEKVESQRYFYSNRDSLIFLVDCHPSMFKVSETGPSHFQQSLKCVVDCMTSKIISSDSDFVAVVFFSTRALNNLNDLPNVFVLQNLEQVSAKKIQEVESFLQPDFDFDQIYGSCNTFSLYDTFWICATLFSASIYFFFQFCLECPN
jgi:ATP-dependent DNA helicase 2 subunit 1